MAREEFAVDVYDPNRIYVGKAKDDHGHSINLRVHVPDTWDAEIKEICAFGNDWPEYRSPQHFVRDAIRNRLDWIHTQTDRHIPERMRVLYSQAKMEEVMEFQEVVRNGYLRLRDRIDQVFREVANDGDYETVGNMVSLFTEEIEWFPQVYREKLAEQLARWEKQVKAHYL